MKYKPSNYIRSEFSKLQPENGYRPTIALRSENGQTQHLSVSWDTLAKIEQLLMDQYDSEELKCEPSIQRRHVIIEVCGGCVADVHCADDTDVTIVDYDNGDEMPEELKP